MISSRGVVNLTTELKAKTLFERLGGKNSVDMAVDMFYQKVLADHRISHLFAGVNMEQQRAKQKAFMTYAFGGAPNYSGLSMRKAHAWLVQEKGLNDVHFDAVAENLQETLRELNVPEETIMEVISIVASTRNDVLGK
jgi:hemoglobin